MPRRLSPALIRAALVFLILPVVSPAAWAAPKYEVLHAFGSGDDGAGLWGSLALDREGNAYGTTSGGGTHGHGIVFELVRGSGNTWSEAVLHNFPSFPNDGEGPTSGLTLDATGDLYGTTQGDGGPYKWGTVFELSPGTDVWKETVIHRFEFNSRGCCPYAGVIMDKAGNLFGTAHAAFVLSLGADGWTETVLHDFTGQHGDGSVPFAGVILDAAGNLYGTTEQGGRGGGCGGGCGTAFELRRQADGKWKETIMHSFGTFNGDGAFPGVGALAIDGSGNLYGTTSIGGSTGNGTVFGLAPGADGHWKETVVYSFKGGANGVEPGAGVVMDGAGNLYGTTTGGGDPNCGCGLVYELAPRGRWQVEVHGAAYFRRIRRRRARRQPHPRR